MSLSALRAKKGKLINFHGALLEAQELFFYTHNSGYGVMKIVDIALQLLH